MAIAEGGRTSGGLPANELPAWGGGAPGLSRAAEQLGNGAKAGRPGEEAAAAAFPERCGHPLQQEGGSARLASLRTLPLPGRSRSARPGYEDEVRSFANQVHRMDYPRARAQGWPIGSGPVASACKRVVGQRRQGAGLRWGEDGANAVCHVRAFFLSAIGQWEAFWN